METVSVIIPTKNAGRYLDEQLRAIFGQEGLPRPEVIIIDSGSSDSTREIAARYPVRFLAIRPEEFNHGGTRNRGARESRGAAMAFLTQDATPADNTWLRNLLMPLEDSRVAGSFSRHVPRPGCSLALARQIQEEWGQCGGMQRIVKGVCSREELEADKPYCLYFANTSSCIRRSVWERFPFSEVEFGEDVDWAERVLLAGYRIVYEPSSAVYHSHDYSLREQMRQHYDYGRMVRSARLASVMTFRSAARTFLNSLRLDMGYVRRSGRPAGQLLYSAPFHAACGLGRLLGERSERLPDCLRRFLSRQKQIQKK